MVLWFCYILLSIHLYLKYASASFWSLAYTGPPHLGMLYKTKKSLVFALRNCRWSLNWIHAKLLKGRRKEFSLIIKYGLLQNKTPWDIAVTRILQLLHSSSAFGIIRKHSSMTKKFSNLHGIVSLNVYKQNHGKREQNMAWLLSTYHWITKRI